MKHNALLKSLSFLVSATLFLTGCLKTEGKVFLAPEGAEATTVDTNHNFRMNVCLLGAGPAMAIRDTYVETIDFTRLSEIRVVNPGNCGKKSIFLTPKQMRKFERIRNGKVAKKLENDLCTAGAFGTEEEVENLSPVIPIEDSLWFRHCGNKER